MGLGQSVRVFLSAGEASGDHYGGRIISGLRRKLPSASFTGLGGREMEEAGQARVVRAEDVAHMGITEVLRHAPRVYREYGRLVESIRRERPDVAVLIDFPDVNFRLARHLRRAGVPVVWFVSPQLWAWKRGRLKWVQERVDRMLVIFPFEEPFYRARGVAATFVGHPLAAREEPIESREAFAARFGLTVDAVWISLLPGSRMSEIENNLAAMLDGGNQAMQQQGSTQYELLVPLAPTIPEARLRRLLEEAGAGGGSGTAVRIVRDAPAALAHARASVVASGTATVQGLVAGNPFVVVYRVSGVTFALARRLVRYPEEIGPEVDADGNLPVGMVNLIAGRRIVPELLNRRFTGAAVAAALRPLLEDGPERQRMMADLAEARGRLEAGSGGDPIARVCDAVQELLSQRV